MSLCVLKVCMHACMHACIHACVHADLCLGVPACICSSHQSLCHTMPFRVSLPTSVKLICNSTPDGNHSYVGATVRLGEPSRNLQRSAAMDRDDMGPLLNVAYVKMMFLWNNRRSEPKAPCDASSTRAWSLGLGQRGSASIGRTQAVRCST